MYVVFFGGVEDCRMGFSIQITGTLQNEAFSRNGVGILGVSVHLHRSVHRCTYTSGYRKSVAVPIRESV